MSPLLWPLYRLNTSIKSPLNLRLSKECIFSAFNLASYGIFIYELLCALTLYHQRIEVRLCHVNCLMRQWISRSKCCNITGLPSNSIRPPTIDVITEFRAATLIRSHEWSRWCPKWSKQWFKSVWDTSEPHSLWRRLEPTFGLRVISSSLVHWLWYCWSVVRHIDHCCEGYTVLVNRYDGLIGHRNKEMHNVPEKKTVCESTV